MTAKFIIFHTVEGSYGEQIRRRWGKPYKNERLAREKADSLKGGYVAPYGKNVPVYIGQWQ